MGEVWQAVDLRLERRVAVKVVLVNRAGEQMDQEALARFRREGKAAARLKSSQIASVYDAGDDQGRPFLVMELLEGPDLAALLKKHPGGLPIERVLEYGAQAAEGLAAAHEAGVIHRDVKPSNLMLDGNETLKICDFGIARVEGATAIVTDAGVIIGTFAYMPPEQLLAKPVTGAADVYALGATLFHLLTGRLLFPSDDLGAVMGQHLHKTPPPPSSLRPTIPHTLDTYLITLLAKDPTRRPPAHTIPANLRALTTHLRLGMLLADAERIARSLSDPDDQAMVLAKLAGVVGGWDRAEAEVLSADAERLARSLTDPDDQAWVLAGVAKAVAGWDRAKAEAVSADAEHIARTRTHPKVQAWVLTEIAKILMEQRVL